MASAAKHCSQDKSQPMSSGTQLRQRTPDSSLEVSSARRFRSGLLLLIITTSLPYIELHTFEFLNWDDVSYVTDRPEIRQGLTADGIGWAFSTFQNANWHPVTWLSYALEIELFGVSSAAMHVSNLILHCANTVMVACLIRRWTRSVVLPLGIALFFGIHPQHVEVVAWVSERKELLGMFFGLQSMLIWESYLKSKRRVTWFAAHGVLLMSLLSKQMLVTLPFLLVVLEVCPVRDGETKILWRCIPAAAGRVWCFFLLTFGLTVCIFAAQESGGAISTLEQLPFRFRFANAIQSTVFYLGQTFWPIRLIPFYRHPLSEISLPITVLCAVILMAGGWLVWSRRTVPGVLAGALWFLGTLVPVIGFVQIGAAARADRYMYFPHIGLFMLVGRLVLQSAPGVQRVGGLWLSGFALCLIPVTFSQANVWHDSVALWTECVRSDPENFLGREQLCLALLTEERVDEAQAEAERAIQYPQNQQRGGTYTVLGSALLFKGNADRATVYLRKAIELQPGDYRALINLGYAVHQTDPAESKRLFQEALKFSPINIEAMANLANCEAEEGNFLRALELLREAMEINPNEPRLKENFRLYQEAQKQLQ